MDVVNGLSCAGFDINFCCSGRGGHASNKSKLLLSTIVIKHKRTIATDSPTLSLVSPSPLSSPQLIYSSVVALKYHFSVPSLNGTPSSNSFSMTAAKSLKNSSWDLAYLSTCCRKTLS